MSGFISYSRTLYIGIVAVTSFLQCQTVIAELQSIFFGFPLVTQMSRSACVALPLLPVRGRPVQWGTVQLTSEPPLPLAGGKVELTCPDGGSESFFDGTSIWNRFDDIEILPRPLVTQPCEIAQGLRASLMRGMVCEKEGI
jgi:hypothetical protein